MTAAVKMSSRERQWYIVGRWQEFEGESRANLLRISALAAFYVVQLLQRYVFDNDVTVDEQLFHRTVTWIVVGWAVLSMTVLLSLRQRIFPDSLKFFSTAGDLLLVTSAAAIGAKSNSPLIYAYFLIIALAALRFSLLLVRMSTLGSMLGYLALVGLMDKKWFDAEHAVAPHVQLITLLSLATTGIIVGQIVRRGKSMASEFAERIAATDKGTP